jgi:hypothetical protein
MPAISEKYAVKVASYQQKIFLSFQKKFSVQKTTLVLNAPVFGLMNSHSPMSWLL